MEIAHRPVVLVADDEANLRKILTASLRRHGYEVRQAKDGDEACALLESEPIHILLTDLRMPKRDGMALLAHVQQHRPEIPVIMLTAHGTVDTAVTAMKLGAFDYLTKPFDQEELRVILAKAAATVDLHYDRSSAAQGRYGMIGHSEALAEVFRTIEKVADSPSTVLITGESGTGKELVAAALHHNSSRSNGPFIKINCSAIPKDLIESELFGHERGAFTGAVGSKPGRFELADQGTLFLDEIATIPAEMQVKLLRALQESEFERVGGVTTIRVDVRVIAAANIELQREVDEGRFREDLFYRLNVVPIALPPLRARQGDIAQLCDHFIEKYARRLNRPVTALAPEAVPVLEAYSWPGNIRELENVIERAVLFAESDTIGIEHLPEQIAQSEPADTVSQKPSPSVGPLKKIVRAHTESLERELIRQALNETGGNVTQAARRLEISRKSLQTKMKEFGLREAE